MKIGFKIGIVGLGLIGGSIAKAYKRTPGITVLGYDRDTSIMQFAKLAEAIDGDLTDDELQNCDCILLAIYPQGVIDWVTAKAQFLRGTTVIDCAGTKERVCDTLFPIAETNDFTFVGGHPMAGLHRSGFKHSREDLFDGQPMVIVPHLRDDIRLYEKINNLLAPLQFGKVSVVSAAEHDSIIAFTSQMPHIISNAFIKSDSADSHAGFSAGSYKDMTRVARLDATMWTQLFMENRDALLLEFDEFIKNITQYRAALESRDEAQMHKLLQEGSERKREVDGP